MCPSSHGGRRRAVRWVLALLLLPPVLLLGSVEALYRHALARVGAEPRAPVPRTDFVFQVLWAAEENGPPRLEPRWPWTLVTRFTRPPAGTRMAEAVARQWLASRPEQPPPGGLRQGLQRLAVAIWLSRHWSVEELLTAYGEGAWFGGDLHGLDAAARGYFGKAPGQLALHEAALLAGLPQSPKRHDPVLHPEAARRRRNLVLSRLLALRWIAETQFLDARNQPLLSVNRPIP